MQETSKQKNNTPENNSGAAVNKRKKSSKGQRYYCEYQSFASKEAFKKLSTNVIIGLSESGDDHHIVGITSSQPAEGKSTVAVNLSYSLAELGKSVLLIDCDLRLPSIAKKLDLNVLPGLTDLFKEHTDIRQSRQTYVSEDGKVKFDVLSSGTIPENPSEILNSQKIGNFLAAISKSYEYVIIDFPPMSAVIDAVSLGRKIDGMILVLRENKCLVSLLDESINELKYAGIPLLGFVVNGSLKSTGSKAAQYSSYRYK